MTTPIYKTHYITLVGSGRSGLPVMSANREEVRLGFSAVWRGEAVTVQMEASRGRYDSGWFDWTTYCSEARETGDAGPGERGRGKEVTELARSRLSTEHQPFVMDWLATEEYGPSLAKAYFDAVRDVARNLKRHGNPPSYDLRRAIDANRDELWAPDIEQLLAIADAYDAYVDAYVKILDKPRSTA